jgi:hypothetical protein
MRDARRRASIEAALSGINVTAEGCKMSAYLDKSQGIAFVYSNIFELYKKAKEAKLDAPFVAEQLRAEVQGRVIKAADVAAVVRAEPFRPEELKPQGTERTFPVPMGVREAEERAKQMNMRPVANLKKNLADLTDAHEKLRFLLQELEALTKKKS